MFLLIPNLLTQRRRGLEKFRSATLPWGRTMARVMAVALIAYGSVVVAAPQLLPTFSLGVDDLGGMLLRIYNGNDHERISLFYRSTSSC